MYNLLLHFLTSLLTPSTSIVKQKYKRKKKIKYYKKLRKNKYFATRLAIKF
jgi:hypothetical protein